MEPSQNQCVDSTINLEATPVTQDKGLTWKIIIGAGQAELSATSGEQAVLKLNHEGTVIVEVTEDDNFCSNFKIFYVNETNTTGITRL